MIEKEMTWQSMGSAPEDGTEFIGYGNYPKGFVDGKKQYFIAYYKSGGYTEGWAERHSGNTIYLDYWMPMPEAPNPNSIL